MVSHMIEARDAVEEVKRFLVADSLEELNKKLDRYYMVLILRHLHSNFDHVRDQILTSDQIPSMDDLITRFIRLPYLIKDDNQHEIIENSTMTSIGSAPFFSTTPTITSARLNSRNYSSWSTSVELWFLGQGYHDHLETELNSIPDANKSQWQKIDFQLCAVLWQSVEPSVFQMFRYYKTCFSFWKNAKNFFGNDIRCLFDATRRLTSLKQTNHDLVSHMVEARDAVEEVKRFLVADSLEELNKKLDIYYVVLILRSLHLDFDHVHDQILIGDQIPSVDGLITRLIHLSNLMKDDDQHEIIENSTMVVPRGRGGGRNIRGERGGKSERFQCSYCKRMGHTQKNCYSLHGFPIKAGHVSKFERSKSKFFDGEYQEFLRYKYEKSINEGQSSSIPSVSTTCISQFLEGHSP